MGKKSGSKGYIIITAISIIAAVILGVFMLLFPLSGRQALKFSEDDAYSYLENIAKEPHSVFDRTQLEHVRQYIVDTVEGFGLPVNVVKHKATTQVNGQTGEEETVEINNIYAEIPGTSGQYILLMAHYDSSPYKIKYGEVTSGSHGAADDGYGVATMLEIMRLFHMKLLQSSGTPLVNGIKFVFTDSEETGLNGAEALVHEYDQYLSDVNLVVNIEARGNHGPLYMFQTSEYNTKIINLYSKVANPFSYSVAAEVYKYLPSDSDLTPFLNAGYDCINFSTLNDLRNYHTKNDILENVSKSALKAYGSQVYPLVTTYAYNKAYSDDNSFESSSDSVFFTLLPGVLVHYPVSVSWIMIGLVIAVAVLVTIFSLKQKIIRILSVMKALFMWIIFLLLAAVVGFLAILLPCKLTGTTFHLTFMPYVPFDRGLLALAAIVIFIAAVGYVKLLEKIKCNRDEVLTGGMYLNIIFLLIFAFALHGGTYLFLWPVLLTAVYIAFEIPVADHKWHTVLKYIVRVLLIMFIVLMYYLLVYSLFLALTIGALAVMALLLSIPLSILASSVYPEGLNRS